MTWHDETSNWREIPAYIELLSYFIKPKPISRVRNFDSFSGLKQSQISRALEEYVKNGDLIRCEIAESLVEALKSVELKRLAKERGLPISGVKIEVAERLVKSDPDSFEEMAFQFGIFRCSVKAAELVDRFKAVKLQKMVAAKQESFERLLNGESRSAYKIASEHYRHYPMHGWAVWYSVPYLLGEIDEILKGKPPMLRGVKETELKYLRAAACMSIIWPDESPEAWLPENVAIGGEFALVGVNHLKAYGRIRNKIRRFTDEQSVELKFTFDDFDVHSCELCRKLAGKVFLSNEILDFPLEGCSSSFGCRFNLEQIFKGDLTSNINIDYGDKGLVILDPGEEDEIVERLRFLKSIFERDLISVQEYEAKKAEILTSI